MKNEIKATLKHTPADKEKVSLPSADALLAFVLTHQCRSLEYKIAQGEVHDVGIFHLEGFMFAWRLEWEIREGLKQFHLEVFHVRPRSKKLVADRYFDNIEE